MATGSTKFKNSINLEPLAADPASPAEGDIFVSDGTSRTAGVWQYLGAAWIEYTGVTSTQTLTNKTLTAPTITSGVLNTAVSGTAVLDEDTMSSDSDTQLATQQSIKAYVDAQVTAQDLDISGDSGTDAIDLDSETLAFTGGTNITTAVTTDTVTINLDASPTGVTIGDGNTINAQDDAFTIDDATDATKQIVFDAAGTTGTKTTITGSQTVDRVITLPDAADTLVGKATTDTLTNKTIDQDGAGNSITNLADASIKSGAAIDAAKIHDASVSNTEFGYLNGVTSAIQTQIDTKTDTGTANEITLTGTTIGLSDDPVIPGTDAMVVPVGTTAQQVSTTAGALRYNSTTGSFEGYTTSWGALGGSGSGGINYLEGDNNDASTIGDWVTYNDTPGENPVSGVEAASTITFATNATTPLRGDADFKWVNTAADLQGEGASCAFTCDVADKGQKLTISFDYDTSDAGYADDDIRISVYDVTNSNLIRVNGEDLKGGKGTHYAQFQTASDSTSYRLIMHQSSTNATGYSLYFDNFKVGPSGDVVGAFDNSMVRLEGDNNHGSTNTRIRRFTTTVTNTGGAITYADSSTAGASFTINEAGVYSMTWADERSGGVFHGGFSLNSSQLTTNIQSITSTDILSINESVASASMAVSWTGLLEKGDIIRAHDDGVSGGTLSHFTISKVGEGKGHSVGGGREIVVRGAGSGNTVTTANVTNLDFTEVEDTTASWNGSQFTAPETGQYLVNGTIRWSTGGTGTVKAYIDGTFSIAMGIEPTSSSTWLVGGTIKLDKGEVLSIRTDRSATLANDATLHHIHIQKLASPQTSLETETVAARYTEQGQTITTSNGDLIFDELVYDTHNAYNTSTGDYTVPVSGYYHVQVKYRGGVVGVYQIGLENNNTIIARSKASDGADSTTPIISEVFYFNKGDVIDSTGDAPSTTTTTAASDYNTFTITRIK